MVQPKGVKQKMFRQFLTNNTDSIIKYLIAFLFGVLLTVLCSYIFNEYKINSAYENIDILTKQLDSLKIEIAVNDAERIKLEQQIQNKKLEIQEVTIIKYKRPTINSADSSFKYLKGFIQ
jgi:hypothetical protein